MRNRKFLSQARKNIMVAVSGGRSSAMMARIIQTSEKYKNYNKLYVFANTGMERKQTINFLRNIEKYWGIEIKKVEGIYSKKMGIGVSYNIIKSYNDLDMQANTFSQAIMHKNKGIFKGVPNSAAPYCSSMLKTIHCKKLADDIFRVNNYITAIGFRAEDMPKRITWVEIENDENRIFPLLSDFRNDPISNSHLNRWWSKQKFKLELHGNLGNCELCWKKSRNILIDNIRYGTRFV